MYRTSHMFEAASPAFLHIKKKIESLKGVESVDVGEEGGLDVILEGGVNQPLRESVLDIGRRSMIPVRVAYRMSSGRVFEESKGSKTEWVDDYYSKIKVPGFLGEPREADPEEIASDPKGALKLLRVRSKTRGRPVVAWRHGDQELRAGTVIKFSRESCLQWTSGRTMTVKPGSIAKVSELSSRRPVAFIVIGDYDQIELPVHMLGHAYNVDKKTTESKEEEPKRSSRTMLSKEFKRIMNVVGLGNPSTEWDQNQGKHNPEDKRIPTGESEEEDEDMLLPAKLAPKTSSRKPVVLLKK